MAGRQGPERTEGLWRAVPLDEVRPSPYQARRQFDPVLLQELAATVREHGVLQPVLLRPAAAGGYELVAGERRWRAAQLAGLTTIPAVVRELSDREAAVLALVENLQRDDLQYFEEAEGYRQLLDEFKLSQGELAARVGKSQPTVANKLRLLQLEPRVRQKLAETGLTERHARALLKLDGEAARLAALDAFAARRMSVRQAEAWVSRRTGRGAVPGHTRTPAGGGAIVRTALARLRSTLARAGFAVHVREAVTAAGWEVHMRVTKREGGPAKRGRA